MIKLSVTKPFTILVAVIMVIVLGVVSVLGMTADLLPSMSLPYLIVITTYPGASPERVEADVVRPLESALGTVSGVENVYSTSSENYGMVQLEFADGTDIDSTLVKVNSALQEVSASLPETCSTPSIIELSMDMMATMYVSVSRDGYDIYELSSFVEGTVQPFLERQNGVASVSTLGLVERSIHVELSPEKIETLNTKILQTISETLDAAVAELDKAQEKLTKGKEELQKAQATFGELMAGTLFDQIEEPVLETAAQLKVQVDDLLVKVRTLRKELTDGETGKRLDSLIFELESISERLEKEDLAAEDLLLIAGSLRVIADDLSVLLEILDSEATDDGQTPTLETVRNALVEIENALTSLSELLDSVPEILAGLEQAVAGLTQAQLDAAVQFATASMQLADAQAQLDTARSQFENSREEAMKSANLDALLSVSTLSQLIYAQNFSMPAGYIDDKDDNSWLLKVGTEYETIDDISQALLVSMDAIGEVRLNDVATVTVLDNAGQSYARLNGEQAVILSIFKGSTTGTNETANNCLAAFEELESKYEGTHLATLMNQGSYIDLIIDSVMSSMILGAILAIVILALFLKDFKPTLLVALGIPLSVLFALVLMYFTGISLNMMTLSGLALGIGMLVDNSVVVMENIYRLRARGVGAARAAVQGTKQVAGSIIASTLTTVCVFLPLVFTTGMVQELLLPFGLSIGYCLMASLIVALTVIPAAGSTLLKNTKPKEHPLFDKFLNVYGKFLKWCLNHKAIPLTASIALLALTIWAVLNMGIVLLPSMTANQISVSVNTPSHLTREESYSMADDLIEAMLSVDGVDEIGVMDAGSTAGLLGGAGGSNDSYGSYTFFIVLPDKTTNTRINEISKELSEVVSDFECNVDISSGSMDDLTAMLGSGLSVDIYGDDLQTMQTISGEITQIVSKVDGYTGISSSFANGDPTLLLVIDKDKAMASGLTVAQIYMEVAERMTTSATSTTVTLDGVSMEITVHDNSDPLTLENLLDMEISGTSMDSTGASVTKTYKLSDFATLEETTSISSINRENQTRVVSVTAGVLDGYNATLLSRQLQVLLDEYVDSGALPYGYTVSISGESSTVNDMVEQLGLLLLLGCVFIYLVMVAQFQSLLSPFIVLFTVPLAFTGGMLGLLIAGQQLSLLSLMGFAVLMGTIVNNGIVYVDYTNLLRLGGMDRHDALIAAGKTRMRPILMTVLTTIIAMFQMVFSDDMAGQLGGGMAIVIIGGMIYGTLMTLIIVPVIYDLLFRRQPKLVDIGDDNLDDVPDDAAEFLAEIEAQRIAQAEAESESEET